MNGVSAAINATLPLLETLFSLGIPGVLLMLVSIPAPVTAVIFILDCKRGKRVSRMLEVYREDTRESLRVMTEKSEASLQEVNRKYDEVAEYYHKDVTLVRNYRRMNGTLQTLVMNSARAVEHLSTIVETGAKL